MLSLSCSGSRPLVQKSSSSELQTTASLEYGTRCAVCSYGSTSVCQEKVKGTYGCRQAKVLNGEVHEKWQNCPRFGSLLEEEARVPSVSVAGLDGIDESSVQTGPSWGRAVLCGPVRGWVGVVVEFRVTGSWGVC